MASQQISLGIGSPADIPNFLTFGLFPVDDGGGPTLTLCVARNARLTPKRDNASLSPIRRNARLTPKRDNESTC